MTTNSSAIKRKREEFYSSNSIHRHSSIYVRKPKTLQSILQQQSTNIFKLLPSGDFLLSVALDAESQHAQAATENMICIHSNVAFNQQRKMSALREETHDSAQNFYDVLQGQKPYHTVFNVSAPLGISHSSEIFYADGHKDNESNTVTIIVSELGNIILIAITQNERSVSSAVSAVPLIAKNEKITFCSFLNSTIAIVGSSNDNIYIIRCETLKSSKQEELKVTIEHFNRSTQSVFGMLLQNGAKLIGLMPDDSYQSQIDSSTASVSKFVILLLSVGIVRTDFKSHNSLWLHTVELPLTTALQSTSVAVPTIMHRLLVSQRIRFGGDNDHQEYYPG